MVEVVNSAGLVMARSPMAADQSLADS